MAARGTPQVLRHYRCRLHCGQLGVGHHQTQQAAAAAACAAAAYAAAAAAAVAECVQAISQLKDAG
jgi:hypothetical protein